MLGFREKFACFLLGVICWIERCNFSCFLGKNFSDRFFRSFAIDLRSWLKSKGLIWIEKKSKAKVICKFWLHIKHLYSFRRLCQPKTLIKSSKFFRPQIKTQNYKFITWDSAQKMNKNLIIVYSRAKKSTF